MYFVPPLKLSNPTGFLGEPIIWSGVISVLAFGIAGKLFGSLHVSHDDERTGLDLSFHGERGYTN